MVAQGAEGWVFAQFSIDRPMKEGTRTLFSPVRLTSIAMSTARLEDLPYDLMQEILWLTGHTCFEVSSLLRELNHQWHGLASEFSGHRLCLFSVRPLYSYENVPEVFCTQLTYQEAAQRWPKARIVLKS